METIIQQQSPGDAHRLLNVFVGNWFTEGQTIANATNPMIKIHGTDSYEWLEGGFFLLHYVDVQMGQEKVKAIEIISYDPSRGIYPSQSFDNKGNISKYGASIKDGVWTLKGETERATIHVNETMDELNIKWEKLTNERDWLAWMNLRLSKRG